MLDWMFRPQCAACGLEAHNLCIPCRASLVELGAACDRCAEPVADGHARCRRCITAPLPLERIVSPWRFGGGLASAIRRLKFAGRTHIARDLAPLWAPLIAAVAVDDAVITPIPLHWRRRLVRGYDHAWHLAVHACAASGLASPMPVLRRIRGGPPQSTLDQAARRANLMAAFVLRARIDVAGRTVVLVDDVVTTGATMAAAARPLLEGGAVRVIGVALARATSFP